MVDNDIQIMSSWQKSFNERLIQCIACPRLVTWREQVANKEVHIVKRHLEETYWGKPVPTFGDANGRLLIVGLAPAAHGANRTGQMFTGDRSGDWLYRAMHKAGFANQATSVSANDGLELNDAMITAVCHCAPPDNKPTNEEILNCRRYLQQELNTYSQIQVIIALGKIAFDNALTAIHTALGVELPKPKPAFFHGVEYEFETETSTSSLLGANVLSSNQARKILLIGSYHPSQQNTFTGKLTEPMFDAIFSRAMAYLAQK